MRSYRLEFTRLELDNLRAVLTQWQDLTDAELHSGYRTPDLVAAWVEDIRQVQHFDDRHVHTEYAELPERARPRCRAYGCTSGAIQNGYCSRHGKREDDA